MTSHSNWEISLYEVHRKPHEMITDESLIAVSPRALHAELMCPICLDLMRNTQTTKECLHRFCQECIITALRSGNKECPTCRKKLVSKRSLRPDPNFDALIAKIYPNREELLSQEKHHPIRPLLQNPVPKKKRKSGVNATSTGTGTGDTSPSSSRASTPQIGPPEKKIKTSNESVCSDDSESESIIGPPSRHGIMPKIEFQLRPHPLDEEVSDYIIRNLCSTPKTTVAHLVNFLHLIEKSNHQDIDSSDFVLSAIPLGCNTATVNYNSLPSSMNLKQITEQYWVPGEKLKLFFSLANTK